MLGCDIVVAGSKKALVGDPAGREPKVFVNLHETYPGDFTRDADFSLPTRRLRRAIEERVGAGGAHFVEAERLADGARRRRDRHQHADGRLRLAAGRHAGQSREVDA